MNNKSEPITQFLLYKALCDCLLSVYYSPYASPYTIYLSLSLFTLQNMEISFRVLYLISCYSILTVPFLP